MAKKKKEAALDPAKKSCFQLVLISSYHIYFCATDDELDKFFDELNMEGAVGPVFVPGTDYHIFRSAMLYLYKESGDY